MDKQSKKPDTLLNILFESCCMVKNVITALLVSIYGYFVSPAKKQVIGEIVLITGSGRGIGRQLSLRFSELGAILVLWDINESDNEETARQIRDRGGTCFTYTCDVGNHKDVYHFGECVRQDVGEVSILVNNAGVVTGRPFIDCPDEMIEKTFNVNLLAHFWTVKCFLPSMMERNHGHIVNISSSTGLVGLKNLADYSASKFGVVGFTEVLNYEIVFSGYTGITTTLICPSFIKTGMFEGCEMRFPAVLPPLEVSQCVDRIMEGILTNKIMVCMPKVIYSFAILKTLLPMTSMLEIIKFFGAASFMDTFVGRRKQSLLGNGQVPHDVVSVNKNLSSMASSQRDLSKQNGHRIS